MTLIISNFKYTTQMITFFLGIIIITFVFILAYAIFEDLMNKSISDKNSQFYLQRQEDTVQI